MTALWPFLSTHTVWQRWGLEGGEMKGKINQRTRGKKWRWGGQEYAKHFKINVKRWGRERLSSLWGLMIKLVWPLMQLMWNRLFLASQVQMTGHHRGKNKGVSLTRTPFATAWAVLYEGRGIKGSRRRPGKRVSGLKSLFLFQTGSLLPILRFCSPDFDLLC